MTFKNKRHNKFTSAVVAIAIAVFSVYSLVGCSILSLLIDDEEIEFTRGSLTLHVGETYDLSTIIDSTSRRYELSSSDTAVATVSGRSVTARAVGIAYITASVDGDSDRLKLNVIDTQPDTFEVTPIGELVQTRGNLSEVTFVPSATGALSASSVSWSINGTFIKSLSPSENFEYTPVTVGEDVISAKCGGITVEYTVRVYFPVSASVECTGELNQLDGQTPIKFTASIEQNYLNPEDYIQIFEDGELISAGTEKVYFYTPSFGKHTVSVKVNGLDVYSTDVFCRGAVIPSSPKVRFDNVYPHIYIEYDVKGLAQVNITSPSGDVGVYSQSDSKYAALFKDGTFDAADFIELCAGSSSRQSYKIRVKSLGDGEAYTESGYSEAYTFTQLPSAAKPYIKTQCLDGDLYITSAEEYTKVAEYYINFRNKKTSSPRVSFECYIAYELDGDEEALWNDAFPIAATSGLYTRINTSLNNNVMKTSFTVDTVNNPSRQAKPSYLTGSYTAQLHAILPHINYDESKYRDLDYVFPIDGREKSVDVSYSDELYIAAQHGVNPMPTAGSVAEAIYSRARDILRRICTDDMTDMQKAHAIYDWIMWQVTYDTPATSSSSGGEAYSAYYMEGVFADGATSFGGVTYTPYAVCDGMSKAYALMCNIEGIPCVRVVGTAGNSIKDAGGHAWNKVFVEGAWYIVDCTWGDSVGELALDGNRKTEYELGLHDYLFLTDAEVASTHFEPYQAGESSIAYAPQTTTVRYSVYESMDYNGTAINCLIDKSENERERIREIVGAFAKAYISRSTLTVAGGPNGGLYDIGYQGFEIYVAGGITLSDSSINSVVSSAVRAVLPRATVKILTLTNIILVLVRA